MKGPHPQPGPSFLSCAVDGIWRPLTAYDGLWRPLTAYDGLWQFFVVWLDWHCLKANICIWWLLSLFVAPLLNHFIQIWGLYLIIMNFWVYLVNSVKNVPFSRKKDNFELEFCIYTLNHTGKLSDAQMKPRNIFLVQSRNLQGQNGGWNKGQKGQSVTFSRMNEYYELEICSK